MQEEPNAEFEQLLEFIKQARGFDYTGYKRPSLSRRFQKRMQAVGVETYPEYREHLEANPEEFAALFDTILINVTSFFRDKPAWDYVASDVVPRLLEGVSPEDSIRIWSTGCA